MAVSLHSSVGLIQRTTYIFLFGCKSSQLNQSDTENNTYFLFGCKFSHFSQSDTEISYTHIIHTYHIIFFYLVASPHSSISLTLRTTHIFYLVVSPHSSVSLIQKTTPILSCGLSPHTSGSLIQKAPHTKGVFITPSHLYSFLK